MSKKTSSPKFLAHWHFTAEQWREYSYYENLDSEHQTFVDLKSIIFFGGAIISIIAIAAGAKGSLSAFLFVIGGGILFFVFCYLIHRLVRLGSKQTLNSLTTGDVKITTRNVYVNDGLFFDWGKGWSLPQIEKDFIYVNGKKLLVLNFACRGSVRVRGTNHPTEKNCIVPVEPGKEFEADAVIKELTETWWQKTAATVKENK